MSQGPGGIVLLPEQEGASEGARRPAVTSHPAGARRTEELHCAVWRLAGVEHGAADVFGALSVNA